MIKLPRCAVIDPEDQKKLDAAAAKTECNT